MNRIHFKEEKTYSTTVRALMRKGAAFETGETEKGLLWVECEASALQDEPKAPSETLAKRQALSQAPRQSFSIDPEAITRGFWQALKIFAVLCLILALPFLALIPAFWAGVMRGIGGGGEE